MAQQPPAIVNGELAASDAYPETVALLRGTDSFCTGSLIHPEWILTAAHCLDDEPGSFDVGFGSDTSSLVDRIAAAEVILHPDYEAVELIGAPADDVALVRLAEPKTDVFPMTLNAEPLDDSWLDTALTSVGFGVTELAGTGAGLKRHADVPITDTTDTTVLTFDPEGRSTCFGDSGGPGVVQTGDGYTQVGITSWGVACGLGSSGAMRVDAYLPWIAAQGVDVRTEPAAPPSFTCSHEVDDDEAVGVVPFDLNCAIDASDLSGITAVTWLFGDGGTATGPTASHTYTEAGQYTVQMCAEGESGAGPWNHCAYQPGYVRACATPAPSFSVVRSDRLQEPLTFELLNETAIDPYGCVQDMAWEVYAGNEAAGEPLETLNTGWSPRYTFDEHGVYTLVLHVGGYGGTAASTLTVDTRSGAGLGCAQAGAETSWLNWLNPLRAFARR